MSLLWSGLQEAMRLVFSFDQSVMAAAFRSVWISTLAIVVASMIGLPLGIFLARSRFLARDFVVLMFRVGMGFPTVFVGIVCFAIFSRQGPLGTFEILYTPWVIVVGEFFLALPIIVSLSYGGVMALDRRVGETAFVLGASLMRRCRTYLSEARVGIVLAILTAFCRCVTELGIAMMVGGNIQSQTRTLATATAMETSRGELGRGLAMGIILLVIALLVTLVIVFLSREKTVSKNA